ncbi:MAG: STAS domain-containing protein [Xanthomonadales bacterium]|nr:STAS domain-containing protein [Xanthomonadales bacterium]
MTTPEASLEFNEAGRARLSGAVDFDTVPPLYQRMLDSEHRDTEVDLSGLERADSAALALLLEWQSRLKAKGATLTVRHAPSHLRQLADLCEASALLGLERTGGEQT